MNTIEAVFKNALALNPEQKTDLIDCLFKGMDQTKPETIEKWKNEAESRLDAYEQGKLKSVSLDEVMSKYK